MKQQHLLLVSIGPVQEFIADARSVKDLWVGSYLLSYMSHEAMMLMKKNLQAEIILPQPGNRLLKPMRYASVSNRILAIVPESTPQELAEDLEKVKTTLFEKCWQEKVVVPIEKLVKATSGFDIEHLDLWKIQRDDLWEFMWAAIPISEDDLKNRYKANSEEIQRALEERKLTRTFKQTEGSHAPKCSQCGRREIMAPKEVSAPKFWEELSRKSGRIRSGEKLCAICLIKRLLDEKTIFGFSERVGFDSTADIATRSFKKALKNNNISDLELKGFLNTAFSLIKVLPPGDAGSTPPKVPDDIPGILFFRDQLNTDRLSKEFCPRGSDDKAFKEAVREPSKALANALEKIERKPYRLKPCKYYALLAMDGDEMGKFISGADTKKEQRKRSRLLGDLAIQMPKELAEFDWVPIYSGGDDLLAMGPLEKALDAALHIREMFRTAMDSYGEAHTISGGMVITHYRNSLRKSLQMLRENVVRAKAIHKRDALVTSVWVGSGSIFVSGSKWNRLNSVHLSLLSQLDTGLSVSFVHDLLMEMDAFYDESHFNEEMFLQESKRIFKRRHTCENGYDEPAKVLLKEMAFMAKPASVFGQRGGVEETKDNFVNILRTVAFYARQRVKKKD